jgi:hypothetical protein
MNVKLAGTCVQIYTCLSRQTKTSAVVKIRETPAYVIPSVLGKNVFLDCGVFARMLQFNINLKITVQCEIFSTSTVRMQPTSAYGNIYFQTHLFVLFP